jgi:membrane protein DedA with SNARE-associated domain
MGLGVVRYIELLVGRQALAVAVARFVPGLRTLVFVSVGARGLSRGRFLLIDTCAAAWVPLVMTCGAAIVTLVFGEASLSLGSGI